MTKINVLISSLLLSFVFNIPLFGQGITDDPEFSKTTGTSGYCAPSGTITTSIKTPDNCEIIIGGFSSIGNNSVNNIAKVDSTGKMVTNFYGGAGFQAFTTSPFSLPSGVISAVNSKYIAFGKFRSYQNFESPHIVRFLNTGYVDNSFTSPFTEQDLFVEAVAQQSDGKILCAIAHDNSHRSVRRLNADGTFDLSFVSPYMNTQTTVQMRELIIQPDGKILVVRQNSIQRLLTDGSIDPSFTFGMNGNTPSYGDATLLNDGSILFIGNNHLVRLFSDGSVDNSFVSPTYPNVWLNKIVISPNNEIYVIGERKLIITDPYPLVYRFNWDGSPDVTFDLGSGFNYEGQLVRLEVSSISFYGNGKILLSGSFDHLRTVAATNLVMVDHSGNYIWAHKIGTGLTDHRANVIHEDAQHNMFIGGDFDTYNNSPRMGITKIDPYGHIDFSFNPGDGFNGMVNDIAIQPDGKILVCGGFNNYNGTTVTNLVRLNPNGTIDNTFNIGTGLTGQINCIGLQSDGKIIVSGDFSYYNGSPTNRIVRLNTDGSKDMSFASGPNEVVLDLIVKPNDEILICGEFTAYAGTNRARIALLNPDGTLNNSFVPASAYALYDIRAMVIQPDGKIVVGGKLNSYINNSSQRLGRLNTDGTVDLSFNPNAVIYNYPEVLTLLPDGRIMVGSGRFCILNPNGSLSQYATQTSVAVLDILVNPSGNPVLVGQFSLSTTGAKVGISRLKLVPAINTTQTVTTCNPYTWINGVTYNQSTNSPTYTFTNQYGVDSIVTLHLTINQNIQAVITPSNDGSLISQVGQTISWFDCLANTIISNETQNVFFPQGIGSYAVIVTNGICVDTSACFEYDPATVSYGLFEAPSLKIYPNPTNNSVTITFDGQDAELAIYNTQGQLIRTSVVYSGEQISLKAMETGVYFFALKTAAGNVMKRVVKS